jgi:hypothetical protein
MQKKDENPVDVNSASQEDGYTNEEFELSPIEPLKGKAQKLSSLKEELQEDSIKDY